jgi:hypothetical protein
VIRAASPEQSALVEMILMEVIGVMEAEEVLTMLVLTKVIHQAYKLEMG